MRSISVHILGLVLCLTITACVRLQPQVVVITATPTLRNTQAEVSLLPTDDISLTFPTPTALDVPNTTPPTITDQPLTYVVQPGDTLSGIASQYGVRLETLLAINQIGDANLISVGQVLTLPAEPNTLTPSTIILPNSRFIRTSEGKAFDTIGYVGEQSGYIRTASDVVDEKLLSAAEVVQRVSQEYQVDARILLAILEYRAKWLTSTNIDDSRKSFPIQGMPSPDGFDRSGLYKQLSWLANQLNTGYYGWKYGSLSNLEFDDGERLKLASDLNAGTVAIQRFFSVQSLYSDWEQAVSANGFDQLYRSLFGDPFSTNITDPVPVDLVQPQLTFPFPSGETWFFTGGPHGGWGNGSAWSAVDFAPPDDRPDGSTLCYISDYWTTALGDGIIVRSSNGTVILDLDGDGDETTGWAILYLHMASVGRVSEGTVVKMGDRIGRPSCEGGFSTATHLHLARMYNGEWIPVNEQGAPPFVMNGWTLYGYSGQEYQGYMDKNDERREAEQGRLTPINRVTW